MSPPTPSGVEPSTHTSGLHAAANALGQRAIGVGLALAGFLALASTFVLSLGDALLPVSAGSSGLLGAGVYLLVFPGGREAQHDSWKVFGVIVCASVFTLLGLVATVSWRMQGL